MYVAIPRYNQWLLFQHSSEQGQGVEHFRAVLTHLYLNVNLCMHSQYSHLATIIVLMLFGSPGTRIIAIFLYNLHSNLPI